MPIFHTLQITCMAVSDYDTTVDAEPWNIWDK